MLESEEQENLRGVEGAREGRMTIASEGKGDRKREGREGSLGLYLAWSLRSLEARRVARGARAAGAGAATAVRAGRPELPPGRERRRPAWVFVLQEPGL